MKTIRIDRNSWTQFAEDFSSRWQGSIVSVETLNQTTGAQHRIDREPLRDFSVEDRDDGTRLATVTTGVRSDARSHTVDEVSAIWLENDDDGVARCIELETTAGGKTLINFASRNAPGLGPG